MVRNEDAGVERCACLPEAGSNADADAAQHYYLNRDLQWAEAARVVLEYVRRSYPVLHCYSVPTAPEGVHSWVSHLTSQLFQVVDSKRRTQVNDAGFDARSHARRLGH